MYVYIYVYLYICINVSMYIYICIYIYMYATLSTVSWHLQHALDDMWSPFMALCDCFKPDMKFSVTTPVRKET